MDGSEAEGFIIEWSREKMVLQNLVSIIMVNPLSSEDDDEMEMPIMSHEDDNFSDDYRHSLN